MNICYFCDTLAILNLDCTILATKTLTISGKICLKCVKTKLENNEQETETIKEMEKVV